MALESVLPSPPVVGAIGHYDCCTMIHGEKQRSDDPMTNTSDQEREDGEIEEGEILDSGEEEGGEGNGPIRGDSGTSSNRKASALAQLMRKELENGGDGGGPKRKKKKKKKKRKRSFSQQQEGEEGTGPVNGDDSIHPPPPPKKQRGLRYVDHDRVNANEENVWFGRPPAPPLPTGPQHRRENCERFETPEWSAEPPKQPPPMSIRSQSRSPPGLYDSPQGSSDEMVDPGEGIQDAFCGKARSDYNKQGKMHRKSGKRRKRDKKGKGRVKKVKPCLPCKFYLEGKCVKGDECGYSHDDPVPKKMELCKFYVNSFCAKQDTTCPYMHNEFPCKFFHTGSKCYQADNCKFSHDPLTDESRALLKKYLRIERNEEDEPLTGANAEKFPEGSPSRRHSRPSLLGSPPRHIKEMAAQEAIKKIPSLFDIEVEPPSTITPPTCGPIPPHPNRPPKFYTETMNSHGHGPGPPGPRMGLLPYPPSSFDPDCNDFPFDDGMEMHQGPGANMGPGAPNGPCFPMGGPGGDSCFGMGNGGNMPFCDSRPPLPPPQQMMDPMRRDMDDRFHSGADDNWDTDEELNVRMLPHAAASLPPCRMDPGGQNSDHGPTHADAQQPFHLIPWRSLAVVDVDMRNQQQQRLHEMDDDTVMPNSGHDDPFGADKDKSLSSESDSEAKKGAVSDGGNILIPLHLPKKQRELFLRIQQQQRQADSSQEDSDKNGGSEDKKLPEDEEVFDESYLAGGGSSGKQADGGKEDAAADVLQDEEDEEEKAVKKAEMMASWYSSSEDDDDDGDQPLTAVLKKLQQEPLQKQNVQQPSSLQLQRSAPVFNITEMLKSITALKPKPGCATADSKSSVSSSSNNKELGGRDPRAQRFTELRDPRSARNSELRDPRNSRSQRQPLRDPRLQTTTTSIEPPPLPLKDPRLQSVSTDSNSSEDVKFPFTSKEVKSGIAGSYAKTCFSKGDLDAPSSKKAHHAIPYRLHTVSAISQPVYSALALSSKTDPKLVQLDPRLKRQLPGDPRARGVSKTLPPMVKRRSSKTLDGDSDVERPDAAAAPSTEVKTGDRFGGVGGGRRPTEAIQSPPPSQRGTEEGSKGCSESEEPLPSSSRPPSLGAATTAVEDVASENAPLPLENRRMSIDASIPAVVAPSSSSSSTSSTPPLSPLAELNVKEKRVRRPQEAADEISGLKDLSFGPKDTNCGPKDTNSGSKDTNSGPIDTKDLGFGPKDTNSGPKDTKDLGFGPKDTNCGPKDTNSGPKDTKDLSFGPKDTNSGSKDANSGPKDSADSTKGLAPKSEDAANVIKVAAKKPAPASPHFGRHVLGAIAVPLTPRGNAIKKVVGPGSRPAKRPPLPPAIPSKPEFQAKAPQPPAPTIEPSPAAAKASEIQAATGSSTDRTTSTDPKAAESQGAIGAEREPDEKEDPVDRSSGGGEDKPAAAAVSALSPKSEDVASSGTEAAVVTDLPPVAAALTTSPEAAKENSSVDSPKAENLLRTSVDSLLDVYNFDDDDLDDDDTCDELVIVEDRVDASPVATTPKSAKATTPKSAKATTPKSAKATPPKSAKAVADGESKAPGKQKKTPAKDKSASSSDERSKVPTMAIIPETSSTTITPPRKPLLKDKGNDSRGKPATFARLALGALGKDAPRGGKTRGGGSSKSPSKVKRGSRTEPKSAAKGGQAAKRKRKSAPESDSDDEYGTSELQRSPPPLTPYRSRPRAAKVKTLAAISPKKSSGGRKTAAASKSPASTGSSPTCMVVVVSSPPPPALAPGPASQAEPQQQLRVPPLKIRRTNSTLPTVVVESGEVVTTKTTDSTSLKEIFKTIDPTASPFC